MLRSLLVAPFVLWMSGVAAGVPAGTQIWHEYEGYYPLVLERSGATLKLLLEAGSLGYTFDNPIRLDGNVDGDKIVGVMPVYVGKNCAKTSFEVEGTYTASEIVVHGNVPDIDSNGCVSDKTSRREFVFHYAFTAIGNTREKVPAWDRERPMRETILRNPAGMVQAFASRLPPSGDDIDDNILRSMISGEGLGVGDCVIYDYDLPDFYSAEDKFIHDYLHRIADAEIEKKSLIIMGYPKEFVERLIDTYIREALKSLLRLSRENPAYNYQDAQDAVYPHAEVAALELERYRRDKDPDLPSVYARAFCGGDYLGVNSMLLDPPDGRLWLISQFNYDFCVSTGVDPFEAKCDFWLEVLKGATVPNGMYRYRVRWQDGSSQTSKIELVDPEGQDGRQYVIRRQ